MAFQNNAIFWVETDKIAPNPYQPRRGFDPGKLQELADSIRQYGILQPLVVTRKEELQEDGGMKTTYELIAGERRLRASKLSGVSQVPVVIRSDEEQEAVKLELAIIENLQREDLNPVDRARAFSRLVDKFKYKHGEVGKKIGRSREYVSNTIRLLSLPEEMMDALVFGRMKEGHARPLLMLSSRPEEQKTLFKEIVFKNINVRDAERISRRIAVERARKYDPAMRPDIMEFERKMGSSLGTRVHVRKGKKGGNVVINFSSEEDLQHLMSTLKERLANKKDEESSEKSEEQEKPEEREESSSLEMQREEADVSAADDKKDNDERGGGDPFSPIQNFSI